MNFKYDYQKCEIWQILRPSKAFLRRSESSTGDGIDAGTIIVDISYNKIWFDPFSHNISDDPCKHNAKYVLQTPWNTF